MKKNEERVFQVNGSEIEIFDRTQDKRFIEQQRKIESTSEYKLEALLLTINERIAEELNRQKLNYSDFARLLRVSQPYVSKLMNGKPNLTLKSLAQIASKLNLEFAEDIFKKKQEFEKKSFCKFDLKVLMGNGEEDEIKYLGQAG